MSAVLLAHALGLADPDQGWREDALCAEVSPDLFFPPPGASPNPAKRICAACEVQDSCLEDALAQSYEEDLYGGIWAGTTVKERRQIRAARRDATGEYPGRRAVDRAERGMNQTPRGTAV